MLPGLHIYLGVIMPNLSHEIFHEEEKGYEDEVEVVPHFYDRNAKQLFKTLHKTRMSDISMAVELFMEVEPVYLDHIHY